MADFNPEVALGIKTPGAESPLATVGGFAKVQNELNTAALFRQTFAARQRAGELLSQSDPTDPESAVKLLLGDPIAAPFAPQILNSIREGEKTLLDMQGQQLGQSQSALQSYIKSLPAAMADPKMLPGLIKANLATLPPGARVTPQVKAAMGDITTALIDGLSNDAAGTAQFKNRVAALSMASGITPEVIDHIGGKATVQDLVGALQPGTQMPGYLGGGFAPAGKPLDKTLAPQVLPVPGGGAVPVGGAYGTATGASGAPALGMASNPTTVAGDGKPLFPAEPMSGKSPNLGTGLAGIKVMSDVQNKAAEALGKEFDTTMAKEYQNASVTKGSLLEMDNEFDHLAKGGAGFLTPGGALPEIRQSFAKSVNTVYQMLGTEPPFDPEKVSGNEDIIKNTKRMGISVLTQMLGNQREAAVTIQGITQAVPGIENSFLGEKLLSSVIGAGAQRIIDQRHFLAEYRNQNQGNLTNGMELFNQLHPAQDYIQSVMDKFGIGPEGFKSPQHVVEAARGGLLSKQQAKDIMLKQWPNGPQSN